MNPEHARWQYGPSSSTSKPANLQTGNVIPFGPFISKSSRPIGIVPGFEDTGFSIEFVNADGAVTIPIFRNLRNPWLSSLDEYVCFTNDVPFKVPYESEAQTYYSRGWYLTFESILVTLYSDYRVTKPILEVFTEFRECLPVRLAKYHNPLRMRAVIPEVAELGFDIFSVYAGGKTLTLALEWIFPPDREQTGVVPRVSAGIIEFKPQPDKTLDQGKWITPKYGNISYLMQKALRKRYHGSPFDLLTLDGRKAVLAQFEWTPMSLLTPAQRKQAKIVFARKHPELLKKPKELARALKKEKFYYPSTPESIIAKSLGSIIREAKRPRE